MTKTLLAKADTFTKQGRYVYRGQPLTEDEVDFDADEATSRQHLMEAPADFNDAAVVEVSAIAPTGPNPKMPQQIAPDVRQTEAGYVQAGARLVSEVTVPEKQRIEVVGIDPEDNTQALVTEALDNADRENHDDALVDGTVSDVTGGITAETDLDQLEAAENDREKPRKGVLDAIAAERTRREAAEA